MGDSSNLSSEFNESFLKIQRLDSIWRDIRRNRESGNIQKYECILRSAEAELKFDINRLSVKKNNTDYSKEINKFKREIIECNKILIKEVSEQTKIGVTNKKWELLICIEEILREVQQESGMGVKLINPEETDGL